MSATVVAPVVEPPVPKTETVVPYPNDAPPHDAPIRVQARLRIDEHGRVIQVELLTEAPEAFARAMTEATSAFLFEPAKVDGEPVPVDIRFSAVFDVPPSPLPPAPAGEEGALQIEATARLEGRLRERGSRRPVRFATVVAVVGDARVQTESDDRGAFLLNVPHGGAEVTVVSGPHLRFLQRESLDKGEHLKVGYLLDRRRQDPYSTVVIGRRQRTEVARTELRGREITQIPGTFGDPFRVIQTLPGVGAVMSLLPFPIVRGASPGSTGFLVDGVRVPLLFHLFGGPSVIHPDFIDSIQFYPGGFPVQYGGYTAGIVDGLTRPAAADEKKVDLNLNLLQAGALVRAPVEALGGRVTLAGRIGWPGVLISLVNPEFSLSYWDYQARYDAGNKAHGFTLFAFGAQDLVEGVSEEEREAALDEGRDPELEPALRLGFHRIDLRYHHREGSVGGRHQVVLGRDDTLFAADGDGVVAWSVSPSTEWSFQLSEPLELRVGVDGSARTTDVSFSSADEEEQSSDTREGNEFVENIGSYVVAGLYAETLWRPNGRLLLRPGVRTEVYTDETSQVAFDPRLSARYRLTGPDERTDDMRDEDHVWLKGSVGLYHQPPRFILPLPGLDQLPVEHGLLEAVHTTLGAELPLAERTTLDAQLFFNWMDPVIFDLEVNEDPAEVIGAGADLAPGEIAEVGVDQRDPEEELKEFLSGQQGRSYGLEILLRRKNRDGFYGWLAYTLSASERFKGDQGGWVTFDFDRTHIFSAVLAVPLPRNWEIGGRLQYQTGRPVTTTHGYNSSRVEPFVRFDLRIDKRAVWNDWMLDFYVDITNVTLSPEEVDSGDAARYVLPTVGFRGVL